MRIKKREYPRRRLVWWPHECNYCGDTIWLEKIWSTFNSGPSICHLCYVKSLLHANARSNEFDKSTKQSPISVFPHEVISTAQFNQEFTEIKKAIGGKSIP